MLPLFSVCPYSLFPSLSFVLFCFVWMDEKVKIEETIEGGEATVKQTGKRDSGG
jgi:hypothetical protein